MPLHHKPVAIVTGAEGGIVPRVPLGEVIRSRGGTAGSEGRADVGLDPGTSGEVGEARRVGEVSGVADLGQGACTSTKNKPRA